MTRTLASALLLGLFVLSAGPARAQCEGGTDPDEPGSASCFDQDVDFHDGFAAIPSISLDSGWVPADSPIQVRFALFVMAETAVDLGGTVVTSWPTTPPMRALSVAVPGRPTTGRLAMAYGIELVAQVRIHVTVAGVTYDWDGDIPIPGGIPRDLRMVGETTFDPFLLPGSSPRPVSVSDSTETIPIVTASIGSLAGGSIPGIDGGFELSARGELTTTYQTESIEVMRALSPILSENAWVPLPPEELEGVMGFGAAEDVLVLPHGTLGYDGVIMLRPSLYVELLGRRWDLVAFDLPIRVADLTNETSFDPASVHVPLPDIRVTPDEIDLGRVLVGSTAEDTVEVVNDGEADLVVSVVDPGNGLTVMPSTMTLPPGSRRAMSVTYEPSEAGELSALVSLATNDPDRALASFRVRAVAEGVPDAGMGDGGLVAPDGSVRPGMSTAGGCACRAGAGGSSSGAALLLLALGAVLARRRR